MIEVQESSTTDILEIKIIEKLSTVDFEHLHPVLEKHIAETGNPSLFVIMQEFGGWENAEALWKDFKMDTEYVNKFDRIAITGDARWEEWMTKLVNPLTSNEIKFFESSKIDHARKWLNHD